METDKLVKVIVRANTPLTYHTSNEYKTLSGVVKVCDREKQAREDREREKQYFNLIIILTGWLIGKDWKS